MDPSNKLCFHMLKDEESSVTVSFNVVDDKIVDDTMLKRLSRSEHPSDDNSKGQFMINVGHVECNLIPLHMMSKGLLRPPNKL